MLAGWDVLRLAVVRPEADDRLVLLPEADARACTRRAGRAPLELANDVDRRWQARQARRAGEEVAELRRLPGASQERRRRKADEEGECREEAEHLADACEQRAIRLGEQARRTRGDDLDGEEDRTEADRLHAPARDALAPPRREDEGRTAVQRNHRHVRDERDRVRRGERCRGLIEADEHKSESDERDLGRAFEQRRHVGEVINEAQEDVGQREDGHDEDVREPQRRRHTKERDDARLDDEEREDREEQRHVEVRRCGIPQIAPGREDEHEDIERLR